MQVFSTKLIGVTGYKEHSMVSAQQTRVNLKCDRGTPKTKSAVLNIKYKTNSQYKLDLCQSLCNGNK